LVRIERSGVLGCIGTREDGGAGGGRGEGWGRKSGSKAREKGRGKSGGGDGGSGGGVNGSRGGCWGGEHGIGDGIWLARGGLDESDFNGEVGGLNRKLLGGDGGRAGEKKSGVQCRRGSQPKDEEEGFVS